MLLSLIKTNEKINLNFGIWAMRLNNDPRLIGLLKSEYPEVSMKSDKKNSYLL